MTDPEEYGPDNPRPWNPDHPSLFAKAPHETGGLLRMHRAGRSGVEMVQMFNLGGPLLSRKLYRDLEQEGDAKEAGLPIYDDSIKPGT